MVRLVERGELFFLPEVKKARPERSLAIQLADHIAPGGRQTTADNPVTPSSGPRD